MARAWSLPVVSVTALAAALATAAADEHTYVRAGDTFEWAVREGALPEVTFGSTAARAFRRAADVSPAPPEPSPPPPLTFHSPLPLPLFIDTSRARAAALVLRRTFTIGTELDTLRVLTLRARYADSLVALVNGTEIARRNLAPEAQPTASASRSHGGEWESFYTAVTPGLLRAGDNELVLEVRPSPSHLAPSIEARLSGNDLGHVTRGPLVQRVGEHTASIVFETDLPMLGEVRWGTAASSYDHRVTESEPAIRHVLALDGLPGDREIHYQAVAVTEPGGSGDESVPDASFHAAPAEGDVVRFVVYGDVRGGHETHAQITRAALGEAPDFVVSTGDMVQRGSDEADWQRYFVVSGELLARVPVYPVVGNHDAGGGPGNGRRLEDVFALPDRPPDCPPGAAWYAFDVGGVHVAILDSNRYEDERQLSWLAADLTAARARGARAIFAAAHQGPASRGPHGGDATAATRYVPILAAAGASVFFSGHDHLYERGEVGGVGYVVSGGGGAPLYAPRCGVPGRSACKPDGARMVASVHNYVVVEVYRDYFTMCARRPDGTPVEACQKRDLARPAD